MNVPAFHILLNVHENRIQILLHTEIVHKFVSLLLFLLVFCTKGLIYLDLLKFHSNNPEWLTQWIDFYRWLLSLQDKQRYINSIYFLAKWAWNTCMKERRSIYALQLEIWYVSVNFLYSNVNGSSITHRTHLFIFTSIAYYNVYTLDNKHTT